MSERYGGGVWQNPNIDRNTSTYVSNWHWKVIKPANFQIGEHTDIGSYTVILAQQGVEIQDDAQIGPNCSILSIDTISGKQGKVVIEKNARVGANSVVMPGVTVGHDSIIGAGSVITTNVPPGEVWYGSPAKFRRKA